MNETKPGREYDERAMPVGHTQVTEVRSRREPIAQVDDANLNLRRRVGTSDDGLPITEKVCARASVKMMNLAGNELDIPVHNHRVRLAESLEKYGRPLVVGHVKDGWLPKDICPLTTQYASVVGGGALATPIKGESKVECKIPADSARSGDWHGCEHYQRIKARRLAAAELDMAARKARAKTPTQKQIDAYQQQNQAMMERMDAVISQRRDDMRKGRSEPEGAVTK